ncbi:MAG: hypothetical protein FWC54_02025, partial [Actinomycetia bacterium]|nr:hypothetical protein [Actinomycetes bacterium]
MSEPITRTYLNAESSLKAGQRKYLTYPHPLLVPCELTQEKDSFSLTFHDTGLRPFECVSALSETDRYRALANVAALAAL